MAKHDDALDALNDKLKILDATITPKYIVSEKYHKWHIVQRWHDIPKADWKSYCGWRYGKSVFDRRSKLPENLPVDEYCATCFNTDLGDSD